MMPASSLSNSLARKSEFSKISIIAPATEIERRLPDYFLKDSGEVLDGGKSAFQSDIADRKIRVAQHSFCVADTHFRKKFVDRVTCLEIEKLGEAAPGEPYFLRELAESPIFSELGFENV